MENIDEKNRKPRRTRGTPSYRYRNRFAAAVICAGTLLFVAWTFTPIYRVSNKKLLDKFLYPSEEEIDRRLLFSFPAARTTRYIKKAIEEEEDRRTQI